MSGKGPGTSHRESLSIMEVCRMFPDAPTAERWLTGGDDYAVFDHGIGRLRAAETGTLADHPELPDVLAEHAVRLVLQR